MQYLKEERDRREEENKRDKCNGWIFKIVVQKKDISRGCVIIDTDKYYRKTGKKFDRKSYELAG